MAKAEFANMENLGIVRQSNSSWASPLHMVPKPNGGCRPCGDYRRLNDATTLDRYLVLHIQDFSAQLAGMVIYSKVDLVWGYHQVPMRSEDVHKMAVITPFGLLSSCTCLLGLKTPLKLSSALWTPFCETSHFCSDILIASASKAEHLSHLRTVFAHLDQHGFIVNPAKCQFRLLSIDFLGHNITKDGAVPLPSKVAAVVDFPRPQTVRALQEFLETIVLSPVQPISCGPCMRP